MPISMIRDLCPVLKRISSLCGSKTQTCNSNTLFHITYFRICAYITN